MTRDANNQPNRFRTDIQGLRAIGIALVVICHIWVGKVSGGVDVFFVVSAYLLTGSLIRDAMAHGGVDFTRFWGQVALRILPSAFIVIFLTLVAGAFFMPVALWRPFALHALASVLQLENLQLMREATDYLARGTPASPFMQFWALSVQMQFYAVLPVLIWLSIRLGGGRFRPLVHECAMLTLGVVSFCYAIWVLAINPAPHYFDSIARLWEFAAGALCASLAPRIRLAPALLRIMGWVGLTLILSCVFVVPVTAPFPGTAALIPVIGAMLILLGGPAADQRGGVGNILSNALLQRAAKISFTVYLCHWPILVLCQEQLGTTQLSLLQGGGVIAAAIFAAIFIKLLVEDRTRYLLRGAGISARPAWFRRALPFGLAVALAAPPLLFITAWNQHFYAIEQQYLAKWSGVPAPIGRITQWDERLPDDIDLQLASIKDQLPAPYGNGCDSDRHRATVNICVIGTKGSHVPTIALVGGSHSTQWYPALVEIVRRNHWRLLSITKSACPIDGTYIDNGASTGDAERCRMWAADALNRLIQLKPDLVITTSTRPGPHNRGDEVPPGFVTAWERLTNDGIRVLAIRDNPRPEYYSVPVCIDRNRAAFNRCNMRRADHLSTPNPVTRLKPMTLVYQADFSDYYCAKDVCPVMVNGVMLYNDNSHFSVPFVLSLTPVVEQAVKEAMALGRHSDRVR